MPLRREADAGVAHGERAARRVRPVAGSRATVSTTSPASVNFTALVSRFSRIWRSRVDVADDRRRDVALEDVGDVEALLGRARG